MYWVLKTEPDTFSITDFKKEKQTSWTGVRNYQARNYIRDRMSIGDIVFIYHSGKHPCIVGRGRIISDAYSDTDQWYARDVLYEGTCQPLLLSTLKTIDFLSDSPLIKKGNRLSVIPLSDTEGTLLEQYLGTVVY